MFREVLFNSFTHLYNCVWSKLQEERSFSRRKSTIIQLQVRDRSPSASRTRGCTVFTAFRSWMVPDLEGGMDLTLWGCPSWTPWGKPPGLLCRRSTRWGWKATSCPSRCAWPWSSLRIHHLQEASKMDWPWASTLTRIPTEMLQLHPGAWLRELPLALAWGAGKWAAG